MKGHFHNPTPVLLGAGVLRELPSWVPPGPVLLVTTRGASQRGAVDQVRTLLGPREVQVLEGVRATPEIDHLDEQISQVADGIRSIVALGGGSSIDTGKALAAMLGRDSHAGGPRAPVRKILNLEVPAGQSLPLVAVPTVSGAGAEVTPTATVWDMGAAKKHSIRGPGVFPRAAIVDPELATTAGEEVTVSTGLDALSQGLEALWNRNATATTDALAGRGVRLALRTLGPLSVSLKDLRLRTRMAEAAVLSGLAISQTRTALGHAISYPLTARFGVPHGLAASFALSPLFGFYLEGADARMEEVAECAGAPSAEALAGEVDELLRSLRIRDRVLSFGLVPEKLDRLAPEMLDPARAGNGLRPASEADVAEIVRRSLR